MARPRGRRPDVRWFLEQNPFPGGPWHVYRQYRRRAPQKIGGKYESREDAKAALPILQRSYVPTRNDAA